MLKELLMEVGTGTSSPEVMMARLLFVVKIRGEVMTRKRSVFSRHFTTAEKASPAKIAPLSPLLPPARILVMFC